MMFEPTVSPGPLKSFAGELYCNGRTDSSFNDVVTCAFSAYKYGVYEPERSIVIIETLLSSFDTATTNDMPYYNFAKIISLKPINPATGVEAFGIQQMLSAPYNNKFSYMQTLINNQIALVKLNTEDARLEWQRTLNLQVSYTDIATNRATSALYIRDDVNASDTYFVGCQAQF